MHFSQNGGQSKLMISLKKVVSGLCFPKKNRTIKPYTKPAKFQKDRFNSFRLISVIGFKQSL